MMNTQPRLGFIGMGLMGQPMTQRLLAAGYPVTVWNRSRNKLATVVSAGACAADSIDTLTRHSDIILLSLTDTAAVEAVTFGHGGIAHSVRPEQLLIDLSSIHPAATRSFADRLQAAWVDAPVSGGVRGAEQGTLAIMAGGSEADVQRAHPILTALGQRTTHMGDVGAGQVTKICNQMIVGCNAVVIAEMVALAQRCGVDAGSIPEALSGGFADSKPLQILGPEMASGTFEPVKWRVETLLKDLNMAVDLSRTENSAAPMTALAAQLMQLHGSHGFLEQDPSSLIRLHTPEADADGDGRRR